MARRLSALASATSMLLCAVAVGMLARGYWVRDYVTWARAGGYFVSADSSQGVVMLSVIRSDSGRELQWQRPARHAIPVPTAILYGGPTYRHSGWGVFFIDSSDEGSILWRRGDPRPPLRPIRAFTFHWGMVSMLAALIPAARASAWLVGRIASRDHQLTGLCRRCGYDLRATPGRCPECGEEAKWIPISNGTTPNLDK